MPIGAAAIGAGALLLWAMGKGKTTTPKLPPQCPNGMVLDAYGRCVPAGVTGGPNGTQPNQTGADVTKIATGVITLGTGVLSTILSATGGGAATAASGGAVAGGGKVAGAASGVASAGSISGLVVEAIGGSLFVVGIIIAVVADMVFGAYIGFQQEVKRFLMGGPAIDSARFFDQFMAGVKTKGAQLGSQYVVHLPATTIRQALLTSIYLQYVANRANNEALRNFYNWSGWDAQRMSRVCLPLNDLCASVSQDFDGDYERSLEASRANTTLGGGGGLWTRNAQRTVSGSMSYTQPGYAQIIAPPSGISEMRAAAIDLLGAQYSTAVGVAEFVGKVNALTWASVQGYGAFYPGDQAFAETLASVMVGWPVQFGPKALPSGSIVNAWWVTDPVTGSSFDIAGVRAFQLNVVPKATPQPAQFGRARFGGFGEECVRPSDGSLVDCVTDPELVAARGLIGAKTNLALQRGLIPTSADAKGQLFAQRGPGAGAAVSASGSLLPLAVVGGAALFFLTKRRSTPALAGYARRRRRAR